MPKKSKKQDTSDSDSGPEDREPVKKKVKSDDSFRTEDKEPTWDLGKNRFVKLSEFKGKVYINIREFYNADGDLRPGKKGIMLTTEQWQRFKASVNEIDEELKKL
ncbi:RNA polymerase II transcriptional coactivator [Anthonomus grandis grandis]|uniref:RNA polymerase II transcriptional coactivator n=1 Tax=Anthonomus grandis grandis TaxID=2921223 RepID=UPI0021658821|nr:RNA polymerase II transcriptional coactivator [Anthonomus grandis grandis]